MELDELKNAYLALDNKLKKNEALNGRVVQEMLHNKSNKSLNTLINNEMIGTFICIFAIPFMVWVVLSKKQPEILNYVLVFFIIYTLCFIPWQIRKLTLLMKIDFSKEINNNIRFAQQYNICLKRDKLLGILGLFLGIIAYGIIGVVTSANIWMWTMLISILAVIGIFSYWQYKKIYKANIQSITNSLEELKELEEE